jgi:hypothetical protein
VSKSLIARNGFDAPTANIVPAAQSLGCPKLPDVTVLCRVKALYKAVSEERTRLARKRQRLLGNLFNGHVHVRRIPGALENLNLKHLDFTTRTNA